MKVPLEMSRDCRYSNVRTSFDFSKSRKRETFKPVSAGRRVDEDVFSDDWMGVEGVDGAVADVAGADVAGEDVAGADVTGAEAAGAEVAGGTGADDVDGAEDKMGEAGGA